MEYSSITTPRLISSAHGSLERVLLVFPSSKKYPVGELLYDLIKKLPAYTRFLILVENNDETIKELHTILRQNKIDFYVREKELDQRDLYAYKKCCIMVSPKGHDYSIWIQDPFVVLKDAEKEGEITHLYLLEPYADNKEMDSDHEIADFLAEGTEFSSFNIPLIFHGGNILVGDDFFLFGSMHYYLSKKLLKAKQNFPLVSRIAYYDEEDYVRLVFAELFGADKKMIIVGPKNGASMDACSQPMFHIDTFVSLAGRSNTGVYIVIVGTPIATNSSVIHLVPPLKEQIDIIARSLRSKGFIVLRNPIPIVRKHLDKGPLYPCLYNNGIIEITKKHKTVWLPTFAHSKWKDILIDFERENFQIWESLGFKVIPLMNFHSFVENRGAANCIVKQLERGDNY